MTKCTTKRHRVWKQCASQGKHDKIERRLAILYCYGAREQTREVLNRGIDRVGGRGRGRVLYCSSIPLAPLPCFCCPNYQASLCILCRLRCSVTVTCVRVRLVIGLVAPIMVPPTLNCYVLWNEALGDRGQEHKHPDTSLDTKCLGISMFFPNSIPHEFCSSEARKTSPNQRSRSCLVAGAVRWSRGVVHHTGCSKDLQYSSAPTLT